MRDYEEAFEDLWRRNEMDDRRNFWGLVMEGGDDEWKKVINMFKKDCTYHRKMLKGKGTALHIAVNNEKDDIVKRLVEAIIEHEKAGNVESENSALRLMNEKKGVSVTALHLAAYRGLTNMCKLIIGENGERRHLIQVENENGETPLFWAVLGGETQVFSYLQNFCTGDIDLARDKNNNSIFHEAIRREMFDLANIIMHCFPPLTNMKDKDGVTPFEVFATRTSAFRKSGTKLPWWKQLIYHCIPVKQLRPASYLENIEDMFKGKGNKGKDISQVSIQVAPNPPQSTKGNLAKEEDVDLAKEEDVDLAKEEDVTFLQILHNYIQKLGLGMPGVGLIKEIIKVKEKHIWGKQLLDEFMELPIVAYLGENENDPLRNILYEDEEEEEMEANSFTNRQHDILPADEESAKKKEKETSSSKDSEAKTKGNEKSFLAVAKSGIVEIMEELNSKVPPPPTEDKNGLLLVAMKNIKPEESSADDKLDKKETVYLIAAKNGIVEIVSTLQSKLKVVVHDTNSKKENVLLVAIKHKQPQIVKALTKISGKRFRSLILGTDYNGNTVLHLAAGGEGTYNKKTWQIAGAAMQMMWDIKWYQYIKDLVPEQFDFRSNYDGKTPGEIFKEEHTELLEKSTEWLKDTAESCSVVAALIAGVSFATSSSVPGGTKDDSGKPILEGQPAFDAFAISSLLGLYFSVTALIMFLSILTSRKQVEDFKRNLPMKLLFGLSSLFVSIAAMLTSFCAGHFFVLTDKYKSVLFPLYVATCFPITFYAVVQFPLYVDLVKVIVKKVPPPSVIGVQL